MAGDWIKMRLELYSHPRFHSLHRELVYGQDPGILIYTCGEEALGIGGMPPSDIPLVDRALQLVTDIALRDITLGALLRVWCAVNAHCKVDGKDAVCSPMCLADLDTIAGFSWFGEAMAAVGWVIASEDTNSLRFPNFCEWNEPACLRPEPKSNAQRQREWRERQKTARTRIKGGVTSVTKNNDREEKRRDITPIVPKWTSCQSFDLWWKTYPKKSGKQAAAKSYAAAVKRLVASGQTSEQAHRTLLESAARYAASPKAKSAYCWNPATWLNQGHWDDDPAVWQRGDDRPLIAEPDEHEGRYAN